jgi:squalene-associated FAD-dependent desaturase
MVDPCAICRDLMTASTIHIVGAGLAGLAAAVRLTQAGVRVIVHEAAGQAGGRCRSYHDPVLDMTIDNGNHLLLSGNFATLNYLRAIGAEERLVGPATAKFLFIDLATKQRWLLQPGEGRIPWWILDRTRRVPDTRAVDYLAMLPLLWSSKTIADAMTCSGPLYDRLWQPLLLAALNTDPKESSAPLAAAIIRETLLAGGQACRPLIAGGGLADAFINPALHYLQASGATVRLGRRLRGLSLSDHYADALEFGDETVRLAPNDAVILAVPPQVASALLPDLTTPTEFRAIVNAHFRVTPPAGCPMMMGIVNGLTQWIFAFPDRLSVTISSADHLLDTGRESLARDIWREVGAVMGITEDLPAWQIVRERRATFAALPQEDMKRPAALTRWENIILAGDWTATGLPATIEGAVRSGHRAAELLERVKRVSQ